MPDIIYKTEDWVFSYRVAGICIKDGKILLQKPEDDDGYALPGGHIEFGETNAEALAREFMEEIGAQVKVSELKWVAENFFPWGEKRCHQICNYYLCDIISDNIPSEGKFLAKESLEGRPLQLWFYWVPLDELDGITVYPTNCNELLRDIDSGVKHFVYKE